MRFFKIYVCPFSIFILAMLIRIFYNLTVAHNYQPIFDAALYNSIAYHIIDTHCYCLYASHPTVSRPPLWPFIIACIYLLFGKQVFFVQIFYCFLGSGTCLLIYFFSRDLFGTKVAVFSGIVAALYSGLFLYDGWLYTESLYTFCLLFFVYSLYRLQSLLNPDSAYLYQGYIIIGKGIKISGMRLLWCVLCGVFVGMAALTRPNGVILLGIVYLWSLLLVCMRTLSWKPAIKSVLLITCIAALIIAPWTYRNYRVTHTFVLVSTGLGEVLLGAYNDKVLYGDQNSRGMWSPPSDALNHDALNYTSDNDKSDTQRALSWVKAHLSSMPYLFSLHFVQTWIPYTYSHGLPMEEFPARLSSRILGYILPISSILIDIGAAIGVLVTWKRWKRQLLCVYLLVAITLIQNIIFYGDMRFRSPIEPYLVIFFAGMLVWLIQHGPEKLILKFITHPKKAPSEPFSSHSPLPITLLEEGHPE